MDELYSVNPMPDATVMLAAIKADPNATEELAEIVYDELRRLTASMLAQESLG